MSKELCTLTDEQLANKCEKWVSRLAASAGEAWSLRVPVDFNEDPDMLFIEMADRFKAASTRTKELEAEVERLKELIDDFVRDNRII